MSGSFRLGPDGIYRCEELEQFRWQTHGFGSRRGNPVANVTLRQIHSEIVVNANDNNREGDALISDIPGESIGVRTADCVPILLLDEKTRAVAAIHAGWRGTAAEITARTLQALRHTFGTDERYVYAVIGPCIRPCCYEVGDEVVARFSAQFPEWDGEGKGRMRLDLPEANRRQLIRSGIHNDHIFDSRLCTACMPEDFFSYRRDPESPGRTISAIARVE